ncbi:NnrU family protein [Novosphingobium sp. APW14]|uniref:NnrU family protein n=1 Tax=Novosphingobium sp. APW14 TaxID=3077237 RepID=UPI0028E02BA2|nr:NnrU family protein [Novosphingobium sp. APW14]MDT9012350.1 NnrU family protein [Novosphingobium sp. APW14]
MEQGFANLVAAAVAFVGTHFALSHPLRAPVVKAIGPIGFQIVYSLVAFATLGWMVMAFRAVGPGAGLWDGSQGLPWALASLLTLIAAVLFTGSLLGNPALPDPRAAALADKPVHGVFHVTRHPMMWGFALWAVSHAMVSPTPRSFVVTAAVGFLALVGSHLQDRKKQTLMGKAWSGWEAKTSYWPKLGGLAKAGLVPWFGGLVLWLAATWAHIPGNGMVAGIWRWLI